MCCKRKPCSRPSPVDIWMDSTGGGVHIPWGAAPSEGSRLRRNCEIPPLTPSLTHADRDQAGRKKQKTHSFEIKMIFSSAQKLQEEQMALKKKKTKTEIWDSKKGTSQGYCGHFPTAEPALQGQGCLGNIFSVRRLGEHREPPLSQSESACSLLPNLLWHWVPSQAEQMALTQGQLLRCLG